MDMKMIPVVINASILTGSVARKTPTRVCGSLRSYSHSKLSRQAHRISLVSGVIVIPGLPGHVPEVILEWLLSYR
ncbi:unnamed protein product [Lasius platythorax]|uniref:Uncharacterized protein n=1 Tax=Lasius platythorax TaxID=488582 RepID=A0AAV2NQ00_9HYME